MHRARLDRLLALGCFGVVALAGLGLTITRPSHAQPLSVDWSQVAQALGKPGQQMPGDVFRVGMPRSDLSVTV